MKLSPAVEKYVLHWGEMGTRWGTNRTVAQIQALLYLSPTPLRADEIVDILAVARSNVSTSIRELQSYGLVRMTHVLGDRRDYFESLHDVWELFRVIIEQRKQRELNPTLSMLKQCAEEVENEITAPLESILEEHANFPLEFAKLEKLMPAPDAGLVVADSVEGASLSEDQAAILRLARENGSIPHVLDHFPGPDNAAIKTIVELIENGALSCQR